MREYLEIKGISKYAFYKKTGFSNKFLDNSSNMGTDRAGIILRHYPDISPEWLLTGKGPMLRSEIASDGICEIASESTSSSAYYPHKPARARVASEPHAQYSITTDGSAPVERQQIPVYDMDSVPGLVALFADPCSQQVVGILETDLIPKCDGGLRIMGDGMYPLLKSGDIVFYKQINDVRKDVGNGIVWGEIYLISFDVDGEEYVTVRYIRRSSEKDHVTLVSHNEHHSPMEVHIDRIRALALVKASLRLNSIK